MWFQSFVVAVSLAFAGSLQLTTDPRVGWSIDNHRNVVWVTIHLNLYRCENGPLVDAYDKVLREIVQGYQRKDLSLVEAILEDVVPKVCQLGGKQ